MNFFKRFLSKFYCSTPISPQPHQPTPASTSQTIAYDYTEEFRKAIGRTSELGLEIPPVVFQSERLCTDESVIAIIDMLVKKLGHADGTINLIGQCLNVHWNIRQDVESICSCSTHLTIGYIQENEDKYFEFSYNDVEDWLKNGIDLNKVRLHAWLTLDSMEILDFTWPSTRAKISRSTSGQGGVITKHPDELVNGLQYHPLVVCNDFPIKIKAVHGFVLHL
jgi:hypothetical protein